MLRPLPNHGQGPVRPAKVAPRRAPRTLTGVRRLLSLVLTLGLLGGTAAHAAPIRGGCPVPVPRMRLPAEGPGWRIPETWHQRGLAYGTRQISTIYAPNNQYRVIMELQPEYQREPSDLSRLYVRSASGSLVPLESLVRLNRGYGPLTVNHLGQLPAVTLSFNLKPGTALGDAVSAVQATAREVLPATVSTSFQGTAQAFQASSRGLGWLLLLAIAVIYIVLGILYESFIHPLTILSGLPAAGFGALLTLLLFKHDLNIYAFVGVIMLVGLVKKNGIMMIDFAIEARKRDNLSAAEAIYQACRVRFRPIMMTTMAALTGTLPIALGMGAGSEARRPLGLAVVGGLLVPQTLTLYVTPVFYIYMEHLQEWLAGRKTGRQAADQAAVAPAAAMADEH